MRELKFIITYYPHGTLLCNSEIFGSESVHRVAVHRDNRFKSPLVTVLCRIPQCHTPSIVTNYNSSDHICKNYLNKNLQLLELRTILVV